MMTTQSKKLSRLGLLTAAALILGLFENAFPPLLSFAPGVKLGLANVVSLIALIISGVGDAYAILLVRCLLLSLLSGNVSSLLYSVPAAIVSLTVMALLYVLLFPRLGLASVSVAGACAFNAMQLIIASIIVKTNLLAILPIMLLASTLAGTFTGLVAWCVVKYLPKKVYLE